MIRFAHRGASGYEPENTLSAFRKAIEMNADYIELDIQSTKDEEIIVMHDTTLNRTTTGTGKIKNLTLKEIKKFRIQQNNEEIPTLQQVIDITKNKIKLNIEIKDKISALMVAEIIRKNKIETKVLVSSNYVTPLLLVKQKTKGIKTALIYKAMEQKWRTAIFVVYALSLWPFISYQIIRKAKKANADFIHPIHYLATKRFLRQARKNGFKVNIWTVNTKKLAKKYAARKVDGIMSNYPDMI